MSGADSRGHAPGPMPGATPVVEPDPYAPPGPAVDPIADPAAVPTTIAVHAAVEAAELIAEISALTEAEARAQRLRLFAFDVDGVLTDGSLWIGAHGETFKAFSVHDGYGLTLLRRAGWKLAIVTGRRSEIVERRAEELGFDLVLQAVEDKAQGLREACARLQVDPAQAGYMGDDWPDLPALREAGFAATVAQAPQALREAAHWVATAPPGRGAVRELCEWLLRARGQWPHDG